MRVKVTGPIIILKGHGIFTYHPKGPAFLRHPPAQSFKNPQEPDIPAFAHDGQGNHDEGEWVRGKHGDMVYNTGRGEFRHGIDAVINNVGGFLRSQGLSVDPKQVVDKAIRDFNDKHKENGTYDAHGLPDSENLSWRKIRMGPLWRDAMGNNPTRTKNRTHITHLHNHNADTAPIGKFLESAYFPMYKELGNVLTETLGIPASEVKALPFTKYPYVYANYLAPNTYSANKDHPDANIPDKYIRHAPEGYFPDITPVHSWEVAHHLPKVFHYPKMGKRGKPPIALKRLANQHIDEALQQGIEHIPDINIMINAGGLGSPEYRQVNLREALTNPGLREDLVNDVARVPSLMFLFGRSQKGSDFQKLMGYMNEVYGGTEGGLSLEQQEQYLTSGSSAEGSGTHTNASRLFALARKSGKTDEDGSHLGDHPINEEELQALALPYSPQMMQEADRYQTIVNALADHQSSARGHEVQRGIGDIPTSPMQNAMIGNMPQIDPETGMMTHEGMAEYMDAYTHRLEDYAPTTNTGVTPVAEMPPQEMSPSRLQESQPPTPLATQPAAPPRAPSPAPVAVAPPRIEPRPLHPAVAAARQPVAQYNPDQLREFMQAANMRHPQREAPSGPLSSHEQRFQQSFGDPHQRMLDQYLRAEDAHLPIMERILKQLEGLQLDDAKNDSEISPHIKSHFKDATLLAKHVGLAPMDVRGIAHSTGDWYNIAKNFGIEPKLVKVIKVNYNV
jgi:hypothetical protein